jgi:sigma-B regulation protein RsbU (phosphoserine phosphatase)
MAGKKFVSQEIMIEPETTIFLYTDGLTEAENSSHAQFGVKRVVNEAERIIANGNINPSELIKQMSDAMHEFVSGNEQSDDLTMLAVKYTKQQDTKELRRNIVLPNDVETITKLHPFIEEIGEKLELSPSLTMKLNLAVEEAVVNVMNYAYPEGTYGEVAIDAMADDKQLQIILTDCGVAFDPTESKEADTTLSADERPIGGLGIHLVRQIMDSVSYERTNEKNVLTLVKVL